MEQGRILTVKGIAYSLASLLPGIDIRPYEGGQFAIIFLSPIDCHRVFSPRDGRLEEVVHVPGSRLLVHPPFQRPEYPVYTLNERVILRLSTDAGPCLVVMVAGWGVGNITLPLAPGFRSGSRRVRVLSARTRPPPSKRGDWIATFELGSTVVLIASSSPEATPLVSPNERGPLWTARPSDSPRPPSLSDREIEAGEAGQTARGRGGRPGKASCSSPVSATPSRPTSRLRGRSAGHRRARNSRESMPSSVAGRRARQPRPGDRSDSLILFIGPRLTEARSPRAGRDCWPSRVDRRRDSSASSAASGSTSTTPTPRRPRTTSSPGSKELPARVVVFRPGHVLSPHSAREPAPPALRPVLSHDPGMPVLLLHRGGGALRRDRGGAARRRRDRPSGRRMARSEEPRARSRPAGPSASGPGLHAPGRERPLARRAHPSIGASPGRRSLATRHCDGPLLAATSAS